MKLSIILPTYNQEKLLGRCLDSLLDQDIAETDYEIIIVNDASVDNTLEVANAYAHHHKNIKVITRENGGAGAARNTGMDHASGAYLHFVDPDDYVARNCYSSLLELTGELKPEILCFEHIKTKDGQLNTPTTSFSEQDQQYETFTGMEFIANYKYHNEVWWYLINREFIQDTGIRFIEGKWMEDVILTPTLFLRVQNLVFAPVDVYRHVIMPNSAMTSKEPSHYNKLIRDIEDATYVFDELINEIPDTSTTLKNCKNRIKTKQQSLVFFMLVRLMKSNLPIGYIRPRLEGFKRISAYPLNNFVGSDFKGVGYAFLTYIFNRETLMYPFMRTFRIFYKPAVRLYSLF